MNTSLPGGPMSDLRWLSIMLCFFQAFSLFQHYSQLLQNGEASHCWWDVHSGIQTRSWLLGHRWVLHGVVLCVRKLIRFYNVFMINYIRDKYEAKREGVMEEMEITTAGLEMVDYWIANFLFEQYTDVFRMTKKTLVPAGLQFTRNVCGTW